MRLSSFILANMEPILREWENFARSLGAVTSRMDAAELRDHAEQILTAIATDMETGQSLSEQAAKSKGHAPPRPAYLPVTAATSHGSLRAESGFSLAEMVSEYRALRASVLRLWQQHAADDPDPTCFPDAYQQQVRFNEAVDEALTDSIQTYSRAVEQMAVTRARHRMAALGTLAAGLGHDMSNILFSMRACIQTLAASGCPAPAAPSLEGLSRAIGHLGGLAKGLRALSMDPDGANGAGEVTVLHEWWSQAISPFTWALPRGVVLHAEGMSAAHTLPPVRVPAHVLMQAVFNLVQNAGQALGQRNAANPESEPTGNIWVTATPGPVVTLAPGAPTSHAQDTVCLTVRDDGPGMDEGTLAKCTEPFFTTRVKDQGTGLGLFLVRTNIERHAGRLLVSSTPGEGASFTLVLPAAAADAGTGGDRALSHAPSEAGTTRRE